MAYLTGTASWATNNYRGEGARGLDAAPLRWCSGAPAPPRVPSRVVQAGPTPARRIFHRVRQQGSDQGTMAEETS